MAFLSLIANPTLQTTRVLLVLGVVSVVSEEDDKNVIKTFQNLDYKTMRGTTEERQSVYENEWREGRGRG